MQLTTRNATLADLAALLQEQHMRKLDLVAPATAIRSVDGVLHIDNALDTDAWETDPDGDEFVIPDSLPAPVTGEFVPTVVCDEGLADKLGIPVAYLKRLRETRPDLYDANVNGWLHGGSSPSLAVQRPEIDADARKFLVRCFRGNGDAGIARALLSDGYKMIDHLDILTAALEGVKEAGVAVDIDGCDLTERKMYVRLVAPEVRALAPILMRDYRNPFNDPAIEAQRRHGWDLAAGREAAMREGLAYGEGNEPIVFAGFVISNSETGGGAMQITPRLMVKVCRNGLVIARDALRAIHLGGKMDEGIVRWSAGTQQKNLALVTSQARDAVSTFLDVDYVTMVMDRLEAQAEHKLTEPAEAVRIVGQRLKFSEQRTTAILDHFIRGGQLTAGGVLNAVTSYSQTIPDADEAAEVEATAIRALELAASL